MKTATKIVITVLDQDDEVMAKKESFLWATAGENLFKLQRYVVQNEIPSELGKY